MQRNISLFVHLKTFRHEHDVIRPERRMMQFFVHTFAVPANMVLTHTNTSIFLNFESFFLYHNEIYV
jgi:hypothetical protein